MTKAKLDFKNAFSYPFNRAVGMWNILWALLPIIGWFALGGYAVRIIKEFCKGEFKQLPIFKFSSDLELGFKMFIKAIPFIVVYMIITVILDFTNVWVEGLATFFLELFIAPILTINFFNKGTVASYFELEILSSVFSNLGDYIEALLKSILLAMIFAIMSVILIGIPALVFTDNIFLADFYRRKVKK